MKKIPVRNVSKNKMPLPPELLNLPLIEAEPWCEVQPDVFLEGPAFDRDSNLFVTSPPNGLIFKITPQKTVSLVFNNPGVKVDGSAFHKDGRLFVVCLTGEIVILNTVSGKYEFLYPEFEGRNLCMNDLVFDRSGNIYVTHFTGTVMDPTGAVFRISSDVKTVHCIVQHLASPNGISLSPEGNILWVAETTRNAILRIDLLDDGITLNPVDGLNYACYLTGCPGPDSNKTDEDGNLYQCLIFQGRAIVLNKYGVPIANVLIPGRDDGFHLITSNLAFKPGTNEGYILAAGKGGAWIYKFKGLARGLTLFSHLT